MADTHRWQFTIEDAHDTLYTFPIAVACTEADLPAALDAAMHSFVNHMNASRRHLRHNQSPDSLPDIDVAGCRVWRYWKVPHNH